MKFAYFIIYPGKNPPPQNGCRLKSVSFFKAPVSHLHFPNSTGLFTKPIGRYYTKYRFSPDIGRERKGLGKHEAAGVGRWSPL
jgi:hypothetical protein